MIRVIIDHFEIDLNQDGPKESTEMVEHVAVEVCKREPARHQLAEQQVMWTVRHVRSI